MIAGKSTFTHASFTVAEEISVLANVECSILDVEDVPLRASILFPKFTDHAIGLMQAFNHRMEYSSPQSARREAIVFDLAMLGNFDLLSKPRPQPFSDFVLNGFLRVHIDLAEAGAPRRWPSGLREELTDCLISPS
jgi:hypothetical protein